MVTVAQLSDLADIVLAMDADADDYDYGLENAFYRELAKLIGPEADAAYSNWCLKADRDERIVEGMCRCQGL